MKSLILVNWAAHIWLDKLEQLFGEWASAFVSLNKTELGGLDLERFWQGTCG